MTTAVGLPDQKTGYRVLLKHLIDLPYEEGLKQLQVLRLACEHAREHAGKPSPLAPDTLPFAKDGWDEGIALFKALEKTIF